MIKLCKNLFYKPKYGSVQDSIMLRHLFSTVTTILVCLAAISFSAYAFFSYSVTSGSNKIQSSSFSTALTIHNSAGTQVTQGDIQSYHFVPDRYTVTITTNSGITGTGFCIVDIGGAKYYTQQLGRDIAAPNRERTQIIFVLDVQVESTVAFESRWGTNVYYNSSGTDSEFYITDTNPSKVIVVDGTHTITDDSEETVPETTHPDNTPPETTQPEETVPEATLPDNTLPETTLPEETEPESTVPDETTPAADPTEIIHIVQSGESLALIADKHGINYFALAEYNGIEDPGYIQPGQEIRIPTEAAEAGT